MKEKNQILIYSSDDEANLKIDVRLEDDTVWLTQAQMAELFDTTRNNITIHIGNIFNERELNEDSVCKDSLLTAADGKKYRTKIYNLDVIISVGYRVKSLRGTQFRIWANKVLKEYLLKGYAINHRLSAIEEKLYDHDKQIEFLIDRDTLPEQGLFYDGQIFDAYKFVSDLIKTAEASIVLIDNYVNEETLLLLAKRNISVNCIVYTAKLNKQLKLDLQKHNEQYPEIIIKKYGKAHDRFLIIDNHTIYHIGASLKDLGKKLFAFSKINISINELLNKLDDET
jgi:hypothetical protein